MDIGADAKDWAAIQATEKLKPVETELRRIEEMLNEIVGEMDYLRLREQRLRDTNESTNTRVKWFGFGTTFLLIGLWAWQIMYLRAYFRCVVSFCCFVPREALANSPQLQASHLSRGMGWRFDTRVSTCFTRTCWPRPLSLSLCEPPSRNSFSYYTQKYTVSSQHGRQHKTGGLHWKREQ